jgi:hypothetical protein
VSLRFRKHIKCRVWWCVRTAHVCRRVFIHASATILSEDFLIARKGLCSLPLPYMANTTINTISLAHFLRCRSCSLVMVGLHASAANSNVDSD